jgi:hypothetical protein
MGWSLRRQSSGGALGGGSGGGYLAGLHKSSSFHSDSVSGKPILRNTFKTPAPGRLYAPGVVSDAIERLRFTARSLVPRLRPPALCRIPPRSPRGGLSPGHQRAGCPRVALSRASTHPRQPIRCNTEALFRSLRLPAQILCEIQAAELQRNQSHARPSYVGPGTQSSVFALRATP